MIGTALGLIEKFVGFTYHSTILNRINPHRNCLGPIIMDMQSLMVMNFHWNINRTLTSVGRRWTLAMRSFRQGLHNCGHWPSLRPAALDRLLTGTIASWSIGGTTSRPH